jgi:hypothetical protein
MFSRARHRAAKAKSKASAQEANKNKPKLRSRIANAAKSFLDFFLGEKRKVFVPKNERLIMRLVKGEQVAHVYPMLKANTGKRYDDLIRHGFEIIDLKEPTMFPGCKQILPAGQHVIKLVPTKRAIWIDHSKYPPETLRKVNSLARRLERRVKQETAHAA